ncbi:MAG: RNA polymerase sigma factor [Planctomycetota bacterium]
MEVLCPKQKPPKDHPIARGAADARLHYQAYGRELWARFYVLCCSRDLAWEALQHAFLKLLERPDTQLQNPRGWLFRVGSNWLVDAARSRGKGPVPAGDVDHLPGPAPEPATMLLSAELRNEVRQALTQLRAPEREVVVLRYALDWSARRIADTLGLNPETVHMRLSRARRRLKELLTKVRSDEGRR